jgi:hypothetical protein
VSGGVAERLMAPVLKTGGAQALAGSNPAPSAAVASYSVVSVRNSPDQWLVTPFPTPTVRLVAFSLRPDRPTDTVAFRDPQCLRRRPVPRTMGRSWGGGSPRPGSTSPEGTAAAECTATSEEDVITQVRAGFLAVELPKETKVPCQPATSPSAK